MTEQEVMRLVRFKYSGKVWQAFWRTGGGFVHDMEGVRIMEADKDLCVQRVVAAIIARMERVKNDSVY